MLFVHAMSCRSNFQAICNVLERDGIPLTNIIGFAADTMNVTA